MADVEAAIAAAMSAAAPNAPPISPIIKSEHFGGDSMIIDSEPPHRTHSPESPLKRSRSPETANSLGENGYREEKRVKIEPTTENGLDEIARMVQAVQASVMQDILSTPAPDLEPTPEHSHEPKTEVQPRHQSQHDIDIKRHVEQSPDVFETTEEEHINIESMLEAALDEQRSPSRDADARPDTLWNNPRNYTRRKHIIPALGALAVDILIALSEQTLEDTVATLTSDPDSDITKEYGVLREAFDAQRKLLLPPGEICPFFDADKLGIKGETREVIRIVNLASTCASIFGTNDVTLDEVNNHFLRIFIPEGQSLTHDAAELYLGLKTQLFLAVLEGDLDKTKDQFLEEIFVTGVEGALAAHHPDFPLTTTELDFVANSKARRLMLSIASAPADSVYALSKQYTYEAFLDGLSTYLNDNINSIQAQVLKRIDFKVMMNSPGLIDHDPHDLVSGFDLNAAIEEASRAAAQTVLQPTDEPPTFEDLSAFLAENVTRAVEQSRQAASNVELPSSIASAAESASRATALALESIARNQYHPTALPHSSNQSPNPTSNQNCQSQQTSGQTPGQAPTQAPMQTPSQFLPYPQHQQQPSQPPATNAQTSYQTPADHLPPNQSDSTPALYERARQAAAARSSTHARREGSHSTRRPWSPEEEKALMMGLDMVKGPHWSQILSLFGPNGSISQILADRTQVQLKDKARNLKLFFLKTNSEMPYYLQCVTGELKTRAPTQAARKEAEEKARMNSEEHQAHMNGILALAGGLQNNSQQNASPSRPVANSTPPQAQASHSQPPSQPQSQSHSKTHSQQTTPAVPRQPSQPLVPAQPHRPVIPAPQPVSLPTLTPTNHQHQNQSSPPKPTNQIQQAIQAAQATAHSQRTPQAQSQQRVQQSATLQRAPQQAQHPQQQINQAQQGQQSQHSYQGGHQPQQTAVTHPTGHTVGSQPTIKHENSPTTHHVTQPGQQQQQRQDHTPTPHHEPFADHSGLSIEDRALLGLKAAMEGESAAAAASSYIKEEHTDHQHQPQQQHQNGST